MNTDFNISKVCRFCLMKEGPMCSLFDHNSMLADQIMACVQIEVSIGDGLPQQLCQKCKRQMNKWYRFRELCKNTELFLRQYVRKTQQKQKEISQFQMVDTKAEFEFVNTPTPDMLVLPTATAASSLDSLHDNRFNSLHDNSNSSFHNEYGGSYSTEDHAVTAVDTSLESDIHDGEKDAACAGETYKCCKGRDPCVVFHSEDEQKTQESEDIKTEEYVDENILLMKNNCNADMIQTCSANDGMLPQDDTLIASFNRNAHYKCHKCGNTYILDVNLSFHVCNAKCYVCNVCGAEFVSLKNTRHHASFHTGKYQCVTCGNYFSAELHRDVHMRKHTDERPHVCEICGKTFVYNSSLTYHLTTRHGESCFICDICGHKSFTKGNFERHKASHTKTKPHMCEICGKAFTFNGDLKRHRLTHSTEKNFTCDICNKQFKTLAILTMHHRVHSGERSFSCDICGKRFSRNDGLKEHRLTHTGEKRYSCNRCGKKFTWPKGLRKHKCEPINR